MLMSSVRGVVRFDIVDRLEVGRESRALLHTSFC